MNSGDCKTLGPFDAVALIVGIIIGAGIFRSPSDVFAAVSLPAQGLWLWAAGAGVSLCGALCYAELAAAYPTDSGEGEYLTRAFGRFAGWYFTWIQLVCIRTAAAIVSIAYVFAAYARELSPAPAWAYVAGVIAVLTCINMLGLQPGRWTQNLLAVAKVTAVVAVVALAFTVVRDPGPTTKIAPVKPFALALVTIMYTYSGWHEAAYIVSDLRDPRRSLPQALILGVGLVTVIYLAVNVAALAVLGFAGIRETRTFGTDLMRHAGYDGRWFAAVVVLVTLGSINGTILSGSRLLASAGDRHVGFGLLAKARSRRNAPLASLLVQAGLCLAMVAALELTSDADGFERVLAATSPALWLVFLLAGLALFVLRWREPERDRPYRVPLYPVVPLVYCAGCAFMLYMSVDYAMTQLGPETWLTAGLLAAGMVYFLAMSATSRRR
ncbi:MAG: amino acid permease [Gemmataceae bacterium]|nr:amino acid permease [Gemmataceae bacterium]